MFEEDETDDIIIEAPTVGLVVNRVSVGFDVTWI